MKEISLEQYMEEKLEKRWKELKSRTINNNGTSTMSTLTEMPSQGLTFGSQKQNPTVIHKRSQTQAKNTMKIRPRTACKSTISTKGIPIKTRSKSKIKSVNENKKKQIGHKTPDKENISKNSNFDIKEEVRNIKKKLAITELEYFYYKVLEK